MLANFLTAIGFTFLLWILYRGIKGNKDAFSKENFSKSATILGVLALLLIAVIAFAVMMLK